MALHSLYCADVPWRNCSLTHSLKKGDTILLSISLLSWKFAIKLLIKIPPHLKYVATLPCEMLMFANRCIPTSRPVTEKYSCKNSSATLFGQQCWFHVVRRWKGVHGGHTQNAHNSRLYAPAAMKKKKREHNEKSSKSASWEQISSIRCLADSIMSSAYKLTSSPHSDCQQKLQQQTVSA